MAAFPSILDVAGTTLVRDADRLLLCLRTQPGPNGRHVPIARWPDLLPVLEALGLEVEPPTSSGRNINHTAARLWVRSKAGAIDDRQTKAVRQSLQQNLAWIGPVYRPVNSQGEDAVECVFPHVLVVRPASPFATGEFDTLTGELQKRGLTEVPEKSRFLGDLRYFVVVDPEKRNAFELRNDILQSPSRQVSDVLFEHMPMLSPHAAVPDDPWFSSQWGLMRIDAPEAWDIASGDSSVIIAVIDSGCDLMHEDIAFVAGRGIDLETMSGDGSPLMDPISMRPDAHGTWAAGVAAATMNNTTGVAGVAGGCRVLPMASTYTDMEVAAGIRYALDQGATVINVSIFTEWSTFWSGPIPTSIEEAERRGCVICASAGNGNGGAGLVRPAEHPLVLACGATSMADERWTLHLPDGTLAAESSWGDSLRGTEPTGVAVMAPGERIFTTDLMGADGATAFNYTDVFNATSAATPFVSGVAALLHSAYPALRTTPARTRAIIARTAEKVGPLPYADMDGWPLGTRNEQFGYGRINAHRALDFADVMIRDWSGDDGTEPSSPPGGNFYSFSDIVLRSADDDVFMPGDIVGSSTVLRHQTNYVYVGVHNVGPVTARDVTVDVRITPYVGLEFVYPHDWTLLDARHVQPTAITARFASLAPGGPPVIAKFSLSPEQVEELWDWTDRRWHPCLLAQVTASNDYAFGSTTLRGGALITRRNNIAQRNLTVLTMTSEALHYWDFTAGNEASPAESIELVLRAGALASRGEVLLCLDPQSDETSTSDNSDGCNCDEPTVFLERTRVETCLFGCRGVLTIEKGSTFSPAATRPRITDVKGGDFTDAGRTCVRISEPTAMIRVRKPPRATVHLSLGVKAPPDAVAGEHFLVNVAQQNEGRIVGGAIGAFLVSG